MLINRVAAHLFADVGMPLLDGNDGVLQIDFNSDLYLYRAADEQLQQAD